jgi:selenocysteine lyase/cysteine desulfurase
MLTADTLARLREREFSRLDAAGEVYLDYTGSAIPPQSCLAGDDAFGILGNPHSAHRASTRSTALIEEARAAVLRHFKVDERTHDVCFTANATAALKLVGESYPFSDRCGLVLTADNHNSVNGIREFARRAGAACSVLPLDPKTLRLDDGGGRLDARPRGPGLFGFPAQSNFSGVRHPLSLVDAAHASGLDVLLDAASFVPAHPLDLRVCAADFVAVSFYKMFGAPTGVGALVARRDALARLVRPWFAGGTVDFVSVAGDRHGARQGHERFEDGTPNFVGLAHITAGLRWMSAVGLNAIEAHVDAEAQHLLGALASLKHDNSAPLVVIYGPDDGQDRGGTIAFNVIDRHGRVVPYDIVETSLSERGVFVRGGCFCNPGAAEAAFRFDPERTARCLTVLEGRFTIPRFAACLGAGAVVGAVRASVGIPTNARDIGRLVDALRMFQ